MAKNGVKIGIDKKYIELLPGEIVNFIFCAKNAGFSDPEEVVRTSLYGELIENKSWISKAIFCG